MVSTYNSLNHTAGEIPSLDLIIVWMGGVGLDPIGKYWFTHGSKQISMTNLLLISPQQSDFANSAFQNSNLLTRHFKFKIGKFSTLLFTIHQSLRSDKIVQVVLFTKGEWLVKVPKLSLVSKSHHLDVITYFENWNGVKGIDIW